MSKADPRITYQPMVTALVGNTAPTQIVQANWNRRALIINNIGLAKVALSFDDSRVTTGTFTLGISVGSSLILEEPCISGQAIFAICGATGSQVVYQQATYT